MPVKNLIFDLGGVLINLDYHKTARRFKSLGLTDFDNIYSQKKQERLFDEFEKGNLSAKDFRNEIRKYLPDSKDFEIDDAWNAMLLDVPAYRMEFLKNLRQNYKIYLLSNTNEIHVKAFTKLTDSAYGPNAFMNTFHRIYYSCCLKMRKPDPEIFDFVINENALEKSETIFIDDSIQHVEGGLRAGIKSFLLEKNSDITELVPKILSDLSV